MGNSVSSSSNAILIARRNQVLRPDGLKSGPSEWSSKGWK
jgi:hypothetical protein